MYISASYASKAILSLLGQAVDGNLLRGEVLKRGGVAVAVDEQGRGGGIQAARD